MFSMLLSVGLSSDPFEVTCTNQTAIFFVRKNFHSLIYALGGFRLFVLLFIFYFECFN